MEEIPLLCNSDWVLSHNLDRYNLDRMQPGQTQPGQDITQTDTTWTGHNPDTDIT